MPSRVSREGTDAAGGAQWRRERKTWLAVTALSPSECEGTSESAPGVGPRAQ